MTAPATCRFCLRSSPTSSRRSCASVPTVSASLSRLAGECRDLRNSGARRSPTFETLRVRIGRGWLGRTKSLRRPGDIVLRVRRHEAAQDADLVRVERGPAVVRVRRSMDALAGRTRSQSAPVDGAHELFGFLTTEANAIVAPVHQKAMPVILDDGGRGRRMA